MVILSSAPVSAVLSKEHDLYKIEGMLSTRGPRDDDMFSPFPNFYSVCRQVYLSIQATISIEPKQIVVVALAYSSIFCWWHPILSHELLFTVISLRLWLDKSRRLQVISTTIRIYFVSMFIGWEPLKVIYHIFTPIFPGSNTQEGFFCSKRVPQNPCYSCWHPPMVSLISFPWYPRNWRVWDPKKWLLQNNLHESLLKPSPLLNPEIVDFLVNRISVVAGKNLYPHVWSNFDGLIPLLDGCYLASVQSISQLTLICWLYPMISYDITIKSTYIKSYEICKNPMKSP